MNQNILFLIVHVPVSVFVLNYRLWNYNLWVVVEPLGLPFLLIEYGQLRIGSVLFNAFIVFHAL